MFRSARCMLFLSPLRREPYARLAIGGYGKVTSANQDFKQQRWFGSCLYSPHIVVKGQRGGVEGEIGRQSDLIAGADRSFGTLKRSRLCSWQLFRWQYLSLVEKRERCSHVGLASCARCGGMAKREKDGSNQV